jgi:hypothetical protein
VKTSACTQIFISLRNADPTAMTAMECLQHSLGYGDRLAAVRRSVLWEMYGPGGSNPAPVIERLRRVGEIWNPNKEAALVRLPGQPISGLEGPLEEETAFETLLAWDPQRDLARTVRTLLPSGYGGWRFARGTLWSLLWREEDPLIRRRLSEEAALCRGPREGLLIHPHLEDCRRITRDDPVPWLPGAA